MAEDTKKEENSFRSILKGTSLFGGVQVFNILVAAIRLKFVAVILGPAGMGVAGLFNTTSLTIQQFASLGLNLSLVKEIGRSKDNDRQLSEVLTASRPLILISAMLGALVCLLFPNLLSITTFGSKEYTGAFLLLSAAVFFSIAGGALMSVLQGLHAVKPLSRASIIGSVCGLAVGVPLYWLLGTDGIVPAMVVLSLSTCTWYFLSLSKVLQAQPSKFNREIHLTVLKRILSMGIILMSNDLFRNLVNYIIYVFVRSHGSMNDVGFYQSCNTMTSQYSAIVFTAMAMDYLPRLSAAAGDNGKMCEVVNRQIEVVGLLISPIVCMVIFLAPWVIEIFQTESFLVAVPLLRLLAAAVTIRALMYPLGYIVFAKDNRTLFFWMESIGANLLTLTLTYCGYLLFGLTGLGYAAIADCSVCLFVYIIVNRRLYTYRMSINALRITIYAVIATSVMTAMCFFLSGISMVIPAFIELAAVCTLSGKRLWRMFRERG
ncbi:MAG: oligosaccharide flippase family protein [Muribaculaceae bacterium]|nr:oligosaccharide flippase family protein [Muribaculaceae bacterium]